jgi:[acyl-carrier-protein] S-malonyltransferase
MSSSKTAWLFPGQGAQFVGMGWALCRSSDRARRILDQAGELGGQPLARYCLQGPEAVLGRTDVAQPAVTAISLGCLALLEEAGHAPHCVAGHSLGEYAALCAAGVLTVEETLSLVVARGQVMHQASQRQPGAMLAVNGLSAEQVEDIAHQLAPDFRVCVAHYNAPSQTVLSGTHESLGAASRWVASLGGQGVLLPVKGAWHSALMEEARERFALVLGRVRFRPPRITLYLNTLGRPESEPDRIAEALLMQLSAPVRWAHLLAGMRAEGVREFVEVGPGRMLRGLLRRNMSAPREYRAYGVDGPQGLTALPGSRGGGAARAEEQRAM